ncbi:MAG: glycosyltransferase, partial [Candidatus Bathyarchaeia archaeon]
MGDKPSSDVTDFVDGKISVFIPVYENSDLLEGLLEDLVNDSYSNKEIFVIIDKPNKEALKIVEKFRGKVKFILNSRRRGKVEALNNAV